jgi:PAS domain S-box-containing protein
MISLFQDSQPSLILPNHLLGWLGWFVMAALLVWGTWRWRGSLDILRSRWWIALVLLVVTPLFAMFLGVRLPGEIQPMPETPLEIPPPALRFLAAIPWVLAAGLLGTVPSVILGFLGGLLLAVFETHSPFTPLEIGAMALLFSSAVRQNYRTRFYHFLRHPLAAALMVSIAYLPLLIVSMLFSTNGTLADRLDYAFTQSWLLLAARAGELLVAGLAAEMVYLLAPAYWGRPLSLVPSPAESSIQARFFSGTVPLVGLLVLSLIVGDWLVAGKAAQDLIEKRLISTATVVAESLPYFLETGQNLILSYATPDLLNSSSGPTQVSDALAQRLRSVPYFRQLFLFDDEGKTVAGFPAQDPAQINMTNEEWNGVTLALKGVSTQVYVARPLINESSAQVSFIAVIRDEQNKAVGVLLGRTDLVTNPFTQPMIKALESMDDITDDDSLRGAGMILNEKGEILYNSIDTEIMVKYEGELPDKSDFFDETSSTNTRQYVYYKKIEGRPWSVVLTVPAKKAQQTALNIAIPLLAMLLVFSSIVFVFLRLNLGGITSSLHSLSTEASYIAQGQLSRPLNLKGVDEVGRLSQVFEQMRVSLKARLEELNSLLQVSQGVAANLDIGEAIQPILEAALTEEACAARLVLVRDVTLDTAEHGPVAFGTGPAAQLYANYDPQLFEILQQQDTLSLPNVARMRRLQFAPGAPHPGALLGLAVRHENHYYGALWVAYDRPRNFSEEEIRFLTTLSGEAALAATSARLYATAEVGRQRLEAVLASTPEPVLVTDEKARLLLLNPAAVQVPGLILSSIEGHPIEEVVGPKDLIELLTVPLTERISSREISLGTGKVYYASVSPVVAEGRSVGRVCTMRDITHYKELEQLKSDFVATVSHDLRSPLTLMRGYATMLQMVGDLNEQQKGYVRKIVSGVENMTRLVNNLLDLGRIEAGIGLQIERVLVNEISGEVINSLQLQAVQKDIHLTQELVGPNKNMVIEADRALIQQAMYNLVENAIKYTAVGGQVKVRLENRNSTVLVEIHDSGIGIAPLDLPHLFEKFYRSGRREAYQQRGTGLGLAIVKSIAERHGGRVWVDSQLGKGSVFSLEVPCEQFQKSSEANG